MDAPDCHDIDDMRLRIWHEKNVTNGIVEDWRDDAIEERDVFEEEGEVDKVVSELGELDERLEMEEVGC